MYLKSQSITLSPKALDPSLKSNTTAAAAASPQPGCLIAHMSPWLSPSLHSDLWSKSPTLRGPAWTAYLTPPHTHTHTGLSPSLLLLYFFLHRKTHTYYTAYFLIYCPAPPTRQSALGQQGLGLWIYTQGLEQCAVGAWGMLYKPMTVVALLCSFCCLLNTYASSSKIWAAQKQSSCLFPGHHQQCPADSNLSNELKMKSKL